MGGIEKDAEEYGKIGAVDVEGVGRDFLLLLLLVLEDVDKAGVTDEVLGAGDDIDFFLIFAGFSNHPRASAKLAP